MTREFGSKLNESLAMAAGEGDDAKVSCLLAEGADPRDRNCMALQYAAESGHAKCVAMLLPLSDARADDSYALISAAQRGYAPCVRLLAPMSDLYIMDMEPLRAAAMADHAECVEILLRWSMERPSEQERATVRGIEAFARSARALSAAGAIHAFLESQELRESLKKPGAPSQEAGARPKIRRAL